jgi:hypothetical protein
LNTLPASVVEETPFRMRTVLEEFGLLPTYAAVEAGQTTKFIFNLDKAMLFDWATQMRIA